MSPRRNRVTPFGAIEADPARGLFMGNRGILHDETGRIGMARWRHPHWIICLTAFRGRKEPLADPGHYTPLFFLDEAVALAAGHRPCAECRRDAYRAYRDAWARVVSETPRAAVIDRCLHAERIDPQTRAQRSHPAAFDALPNGTFVAVDGDPGRAYLVRGDRLFPWTHGGYGAPLPRSRGGTTIVLTPPSTVAVLAAGYVPVVHPSVEI